MPDIITVENNRTAEQELERLLAEAVAESRRWRERAEAAEARVVRLLLAVSIVDQLRKSL